VSDTKPIVKLDKRKFFAAVSEHVVANMTLVCEYVCSLIRQGAPEMTGRLKKDVMYEVTAKGDVIEGRVGIRGGRGQKRAAYWGWFVEMGTVHMEAKPFIRPAVFEHGPEIIALLEGKD
jgi:HK97 gp10 family phage protein